MMFKFLKQVRLFPEKHHWTHILIHHSQDYDKEYNDWERIKKYHIIDRGWNDIGYHFGIEKENDVYEYKVGRDLNTKGAHEPKVNNFAIGICLVGNFNNKPPNETQLEMLTLLVYTLMKKYSIHILKVHPHWMYNENKTCPGTMFDFIHFRNLILQRMRKNSIMFK